MEEFRKEEFMKLLNKQYSNVCLENPKQVKVNSIVLVRNIANEPKREPLKLARIVKIHDSRDKTQRVVTLTYHNVKQNKDGEWIGKPVRVDRSINDLVLVDDALNESMLNPSIIEDKNSLEDNEKIEEIHQEKDDNDEMGNDENNEDGDSEIEIHDDSRDDENLNNDSDDKADDDETDESRNDTNDENDKPKNEELEINVRLNQDENVQNVRRSERKHIQRIEINPDEIGECDDENDDDYKYL